MNSSSFHFRLRNYTMGLDSIRLGSMVIRIDRVIGYSLVMQAQRTGTDTEIREKFMIYYLFYWCFSVWKKN